MSIIITRFLNHLRARCRHEAVPLQTKQKKTKHSSVHFPQTRTLTRTTPIPPSIPEVTMWRHCMVFRAHSDSPAPPPSPSDRGSSPKACVALCAPAGAPSVWKDVSGVSLPFMTLQSTALSVWKCPSTCVLPELTHDSAQLFA